MAKKHLIFNEIQIGLCIEDRQLLLQFTSFSDKVTSSHPTSSIYFQYSII